MTLQLDRESLDAIHPTDFEAYLRTTGWRMAEDLGERASVWVPGPEPEADRFELVVPRTKELGDYYRRLGEALAAVSAFEKRPAHGVFEDITVRSDDVVRVSLSGGSFGDGTIPLSHGTKAIRYLGRLFEEAASSTLRAASVHIAHPPQALRFLDHARLGQTARGSFVVTVRSQVPKQADFTAHEEPFERRVLLTLGTALSEVRSAAQAEDKLAAFRNSVSQGVSSGLCRALAEIGNNKAISGVDFRLSWASTMPPARPPPPITTFSRPFLKIIRDAARYLARNERPDFEVRGVVRRLEKKEPGLFEEPGNVAIVSNVDGVLRPVTIVLKNEDYVQAIRAHELGKDVACVGTLVQAGDDFRLVNQLNFRIVE